PDAEEVVHHLGDDFIGQSQDDSLVDCPSLKPMTKGVRMPTDRRRVVMFLALRTAALDPDILRDCLSATTPREDEIHDRILGWSGRIRHEIHVISWTSEPGFHEYRAAGLRNDPAEGWMTFPPTLSRRDILRLRAFLMDSDSPHCGVCLCGFQDPLELT